MKPFKTMARIHSLNCEYDEITVLDEKMDGQQKKYIVDYRGVKCTAILNPFTGAYYADDKFGRIEQ